MDYKVLLAIFILWIGFIKAEEKIPYQIVERPCETCKCDERNDLNEKVTTKHYILDCSVKNFTHLLPKWPTNFGDMHKNSELRVKYSGNRLLKLQQVPSTNATVSFACRHCQIRDFDSSVFIDVPHIHDLDLSWNEITGDVLTGETFRGPYQSNSYQPLDLTRIDFSHNGISTLDSRVFEHSPKLIYLNLDHNKFLDLNTSVNALKIADQLIELHLSNNKLKGIPKELFVNLKYLKALYLQGNAFSVIPSDLGLIGGSLQLLNFANNSLIELNEPSFMGLKALRSLNISSNKNLKNVKKNALTKLENLEEIILSHNGKIMEFDISGLVTLKFLRKIDLSFCSLNTLIFDYSVTNPWPKLREVNLEGNLWNCKCELLKILDLFSQNGTNSVKAFEDHENKNFARCDSPHVVAGIRLTNVSRSYICDELPSARNIIVVEIEHETEPPKFLRPRNIALTIIAIAIVIVLGVIVGFIIVIVKRKLKREDFGVSPIRYSTVRNSTMPTL
ncbi:hypothetical protein ACFFRR_007091 [Megaselia abdita]